MCAPVRHLQRPQLALVGIMQEVLVNETIRTAISSREALVHSYASLNPHAVTATDICKADVCAVSLHRQVDSSHGLKKRFM